MNKKHYERIADEIRHTVLSTRSEAVMKLAKRLAMFFEEDNPNFDRQRFLTACGL